MASWTPAAPSEWPDSDLLELMAGTSLPNTSLIALSSLISPAGVPVPCALIYCTGSLTDASACRIHRTAPSPDGITMSHPSEVAP